jgi:ubiquinone/menaquinone biosynthesis C-methylase UbiE
VARNRFEAEFGDYSSWIVDAIQDIKFPDAVPAACRGTGNPLLLDRLASDLEAQKGSLVLDVGLGIGGPAAWLTRERSCRVVGIDIMLQSARGAQRLFDDIGIGVASCSALPFRDRTFDGAWALGVVEMLADKERAFREILRVVLPGARVVLYDFVPTEPLETPPTACRFEPAPEIARKLEAAGFNVLRTEAVPWLRAAPNAWRDAGRSVRERVHAEHGGDRRVAIAEEERNNFNRLKSAGSIEEWEFVVQRPSE